MSFLEFKQICEKVKKGLIALFFVVALAQPLRGMEGSVAATHGFWTELDKQRNTVTLEWHEVIDQQTSFNWDEWLTPIVAEAFADEPLDLKAFLLKNKEFAGIFEGLSREEREELDWKIAISGKDRESRVALLAQRWQEQFEMAKTELLSTPQDFNRSFVILAKNEAGDTLGFALFSFSENDCATELDLLGIVPVAQGKGLARLLVFSILRLVPETKYIRLGTDPWNTHAQAVYKALGFTEVADGFTEVAETDDLLNVSFIYEVRS